MAEESANQLRMRPVYDWVCECTPEDFIARLTQLVSFDPAVDIRFRKRHAVLSIPDEARHTWSPILDVTVLEREGRTHVHARLGPEPDVWGTLMFLAAASFFPCFFASMYGMAQYAMGEPPMGLLAMPLGAVLLGAIYGASHVGRGLGAAQIHQLLAVVECNLNVDAQELDGSH